MNCTYTISNFDAKDYTFNSYNELAKFIADNEEKIKEALTQKGRATDLTLADLIYSIEHPGTVSLIKSIQQSIPSNMSVEFNVTSGEVDENFATHMPLSEYIDSAVNSKGDHLITPFTEEEYKNMLIKKFTDQGMSADKALAKAEEAILYDRAMGQHAANLHSQIRGYFGNLNTLEQFVAAYKDDFPPQVLTQIFNGFEKLRQTIKQRHGDDCTIIPNVTVTADIADARKPVAHTIDLVVVDSNDQAHIYMVSGSGKDFDILPDVRLNKKDYLLGFARHMLAAKGVNARGITLNLVPFELIGGENITEAIYGEVVDRKAAVMGKDVNRLMWGHGEYYQNIDEKIEVELPKTHVPNIIEESQNHLKAFFPDKQLKTTAYEVNIEQYIKRHVVDSDDPSKGRFMIIVSRKDPSKNIYIETSVNDKFKSAEVREIAEKQVSLNYSKNKTTVEEFIDGFEQAFKGDISIEDLAPKSRPTLRTQLKVNFAQYQGSDWEVVKTREDLTALGIIAFKNKITKQIDLVAIRTGELNVPIKLQKGTTILGSFVRDENAVGIKNLMQYTAGNATLMQIMDVLNMDPRSFDNYKIGTIKVYSADTGQSTIASSSEIITSYARLIQQTGIPNKLEQLQLASDLDIFKNYIQASMSKELFDYSTARSIFSELEGVNPESRHEVLKILYKIKQLMETKYYDLLRQNIKDIASHYDDTVVNVYIQLCKAILFYEGIPFTQSQTLKKFSSRWTENSFLNGTEISNPSTIPDENLKKIVSIAREGMHKMTQEIMDTWEPFRNNEIEALWKGAGYSSTQNIIFGNQNHIYENMFVTNPDGTKNNQLILKNPWTDDSLKEYEKEFLKKWITRMNKLRFKTQEELNKAKQDGTWLQIPLLEATTASKMQDIKNPMAYAKKEIDSLGSYLRNIFKRDEDNTYNEEEAAELRDLSEQYQVMNRLEGSFNQDRRSDLLSEHPTEFWETNLDLIYAQYLYASVRKKHMDTVLPVIKAMRLVGQLYGKQTGVNMDNFDDYLQKYMKSHLHNQSILNEEEKDVIGSVAPLKFIASTLAMGFNANLGLRNLLESTWKVPARIQTKFFAKEDCFTKEDWFKACKLMVEDTADFAKRVTLIEAINQRMRIQDMDANRIAEKISSYKSGLTHVTDRWLFWFSVAPDYYNRMSMVLAQMIHDGCLEACSFDEEGFKYDWHKDKRFTAYANGDKGSAAYNQQRAQYLFLLRTHNEENGTNLKEGDDIPLPYTTKQITALKDFSDSVFGFYDHDQRAMVERNAIASLFTQFKTYLTAARTLWCLAPGAYNKGETEQMIDEKTGKPMFLKIQKREDGTEWMYPTTEDTGIPWIQEKNSYMEGILYSLKHIYEDVKQFGVKQAWQNTINSNVRMNNLKMIGWHLFVALILAGLLKYGQSAYLSMRKEERSYNPDTVSKVFQDQVAINSMSSLLGCFQDANIFDAIAGVSLNAEPASLAIISNFFTSSGDFFFGDSSLDSYLARNVGMYRSARVLINGVQDLSEAR